MDKKEFKKQVKNEIFFNIPNTITLIRLLLIFLFIYMLFKDYSNISLTIIFCIAAISDWFDGMLARKFKQTTIIGGRLDQVIDRIFTVSIVLSLLFYNLFPVNKEVIMLLLLVSSREILGMPGVAIAMVRGKDTYKVRPIGKITTFVQGVALALVILGVGWAIYPVALTCIIGIIAALDYIKYSIS